MRIRLGHALVWAAAASLSHSNALAKNLVDKHAPALPRLTAGAPQSTTLCEQAPALRFVQKETPQGATELTLAGSGPLFFTTDGSQPEFFGGKPQGTTKKYREPLVVTWPTLIRAVAGEPHKNTAFRSVQVIPRKWKWEVRLAQLPQEYQGKTIKGVYVTGNFRNWSADFDDNFKLNPTGTGFAKELGLDANENVQYKFILRTADDSAIWFHDPTKPTTGAGNHKNNIIDPMANLSALLKPKHDGQIEEGALQLQDIFAPSMDRGPTALQIRFSALEGDIDAAWFQVSHGPLIPLQKNAVWEQDKTKFATYIGYAALPKQKFEGNGWLVLQDGEQKFVVGPEDLEKQSKKGCAPRSLFTIKHDPKAETLNDHPFLDVPLWAADAIWYQIFPDRFRDGDPTNNVGPDFAIGVGEAASNLHKIKTSATPWTSPWFELTPAEQKTRDVLKTSLEKQRSAPVTDAEATGNIFFNRFYGGDLKGIREQISYLKSLGINAVYLNPVFESDSNHRYDNKSYHHIDTDLGPMRVTEEGRHEPLAADLQILANEDPTNSKTWGWTAADKEFLLLVTELKKNGIRVVIDGVFNHGSATSSFFQDIAKKGKDSPFYGWYEISSTGDTEYEKRTCKLSDFYPDEKAFPKAKDVKFDAWWGFCKHPNYREGFAGTGLNPTLAHYIFSSMTRWLQPQKIDGIDYPGIDGVRLDVYRDVGDAFWIPFRNHVKSINKNALIVAENWDSGYDLFTGKTVDSMMNYTFRSLSENWFIDNDTKDKWQARDVKNFVALWTSRHNPTNQYVFWNMLSSHDTDRVLTKMMPENRSLSRKNVYWGSDPVNRPDKGAPYDNDKPNRETRLAYLPIVAAQLAFVGAPVIYYGDEVGMWGSSDPTNRKPMVWDDLAKDSQYEIRCVTKKDMFCQPEPQVRFPVSQDKEMLETYKRLIQARRKSSALRRGNISTPVIASANSKQSSAEQMPFLWGFERDYEGREFAYFVSNTDPSKAAAEFALKTKFSSGARIIDVLSQKTFVVGKQGEVKLTLPADRAVLLLPTES